MSLSSLLHSPSRSSSLALAAFLLMGSAAQASPEEEPYRPDFGLTGQAELVNVSAREALRPRLHSLRSSLRSFLEGRREDKGLLLELSDEARSLSSELPLSPPDDTLTLEVVAEVGHVASILTVFRRSLEAREVLSSLLAPLSTLQGSHPWNPVLSAHVDGLQRKIAVLGPGRE